MEPVEILETLLALADDVGLQVRVAKHAFDGDWRTNQMLKLMAFFRN